jgi:branched-chain amino acid transport system permease protein
VLRRGVQGGSDRPGDGCRAMIPAVVNIVVTGLILGGIYALIAVGLSLQYGVGRVLNVSHGEFIILGALAAFSLFTVLGVNPFITIALMAPALFLVGFLLDRTIFNELRRTSVNDDHFEGRSLLAAFGLLFVVQNLMLLYWGSSNRGYTFLNVSVELFGRRYGMNRLVALLVAVTVSIGFYLFIRHTRLGKAIRAAAESREMAEARGLRVPGSPVEAKRAFEALEAQEEEVREKIAEFQRLKAEVDELVAALYEATAGASR